MCCALPSSIVIGCVDLSPVERATKDIKDSSQNLKDGLTKLGQIDPVGLNKLLEENADLRQTAIFILAALLIWHYRDQPKQISVCFGGSFFSLTLVIRWLRQLWIDKNFIDLIKNAASKLSPLEVAKLVSTYYELMLKGDKKRA
jgi:hypothetical protein